MSAFLTELEFSLKPGSDTINILSSPLIYQSDLAGGIVVPRCFETDLASVPRLPIIYSLWGNRCHREAVLHDFMYRRSRLIGFDYPFMLANRVFLEAMLVRKVPAYIAYPMFLGVCAGGYPSYHKLPIGAKL